MALDKTSLVAAIKALRNIDADTEDFEDVHDQMANALADAIDVYVKSGQVIIAGGSSSGTYPVI